MRHLILFLLLTLALSAEAFAGGCENALDQSTMNECAGLAFRKADAELNALYKKVEAQLRDDPHSRKELVAAQRAWIGFRDAECAFSAASSIGGSIYPMLYSGCLERMTKTRIDDLKRVLQCDEGDLSCPVRPEGK